MLVNELKQVNSSLNLLQ